MTADSITQSRELQILQSLQQIGHLHCIVQLLDSFIHQGPNGSHQCFIFELLGPTIDTVVADYHLGGERLEPKTILKLTRQLLLAIASVHRAGYAHGG